MAVQSILVAPLLRALSGGFCLFGGHCTPHGFGIVSINVGFLALAIVALTALGITGANRNTNYQIARTASVASLFERTAQDINDANQRQRFTLAAAGGAALTVLAGLLLAASAVY